MVGLMVEAIKDLEQTVNQLRQEVEKLKSTK
jgi:hypothetical protein